MAESSDTVNASGFPTPTPELAQTDPRIALMYEIKDILYNPVVLEHLGDAVIEDHENKGSPDGAYLGVALISESSPARLGTLEANKILDAIPSASLEELQGIKSQYQGVIDDHESSVGYQVSALAGGAIDSLKGLWCTAAAAAVDKGGLSETFAMRTAEYKSVVQNVEGTRWLLPATVKEEPFCPEKSENTTSAAPLKI